MTERPILFSEPMVRAILEGRKTQTRRVARSRRRYSILSGQWTDSFIMDPGNRHWLAQDQHFGQPGDRLWVKETWKTNGVYPDKGQVHIEYRAGGRTHRDDVDFWVKYITPDTKWRPGIFMPRWASRLTLEVESVRLERLHDIDNNGAAAEGTPDIRTIENDYDIRDCFRVLWDSINGGRPGYSWDSNPLVWVVSFHKVND